MTDGRALPGGADDGRADGLLRREIGEQPLALERTIDALARPALEAGAALRRAGIHFLVTVARGSSHNAAIYGKYLLETTARLPVAHAAPSVVTMYRSVPDWEGGAVVGISQSGHASDVTEVVAAARAAGRPTLAITNDPASPLAAAAEHTLATAAGSEHSVPATKTYTAQLVALALLARGLGANVGPVERTPEAVEAVLAQEEPIAGAAEELWTADRCAVIGRGLNRATAFETALKIQETSYVSALPYSTPDFLHGPLAVVEPGFPVIAFLVAGPTEAGTREAIDRADARGAKLLVVVHGSVARASFSRPARWIALTAGLPESLSPIPCTIAGQLLALHLALARGHDPASPRGLEKVTLTR